MTARPYTPPPAIGTAATRVLLGCLDRDPRTRWSIEQVDEAAWGVGWGEEEEEMDSLNNSELESEVGVANAVNGKDKG